MQIKLGCYRVGNIWRSQQDVFKFLVSHFRRYHQMEIQDVYKLFYQGVFGSAHLMQSSLQDFEKQLHIEFDKTNENESQPIWESIHPEGKIVRVNLASYKSRKQPLDRLTTLCIWTAEVTEREIENTENLAAAMDTFYKLCKSRKIPKYDPQEVEKYQKWVIENRFPLVSHSDTYHLKYDPHYRLVHREFLSVLI